jgi:xanthine dehydrogenase accessory factor
LTWPAGATAGSRAHVAEALGRILPTLEYDYSVADDRAEWLTADRFPEAARRELVGPLELWDRLDPASFTHLYLLGYDAGKDTELLADSIARFPGTVGLIASASKRLHIFATLRARSIPESALARVQSPIGLPIGAQSPAEIAISVVAEIVRSQHPALAVDPGSARRLARAQAGRAPAAATR